MHYLKRTILIGVLCFSAFLSVKAHLANPYYSDNDNVAFVGNSITAGAEFYTIVSIFQATRFPHLKIKINNYGIPGNKVSHVVKRINGDILEFNPNCISMMLGMNDVNRTAYAASLMVNGAFTAGSLANQQNYKDTYFAGMKGLINTFKGKGIKVLMQSPNESD